MLFARGLLLAVPRLCDSATPGRNFFMNRAKIFVNDVELDLGGKSPPEAVYAPLKEKLDSLFTTLSDSRKSEWFFYDFGHRLEDSRHNFHKGESSKLKPKYFFSTLDDSRRASRPWNFPIDVLAFSNVNILKEIHGWLEDPVRQKLLARLLSLAARVGINRLALGRLYQNFEKLGPEKLEKKVANLETRVRNFLAESDPRSLVPSEIYAQFATPHRAAGLYKEYTGRSLNDEMIQEKASILTELVLSIYTEARVGIVPRLIVLIRSLLTQRHRSAADESSELVIAGTDSPQFVLIKTLVEVIVRVANDSRYSMVSLAMFIDGYCNKSIRKSLKSWKLVAATSAGASTVYSLAHEVFKRFEIRILDEYPAMVGSIGWSADRARAIQTIITQFTTFGLNYPSFHPSETQISFISRASDYKLMNAAIKIKPLLEAHLKLQAKDVFKQPPVNPAAWLDEYAKDALKELPAQSGVC